MPSWRIIYDDGSTFSSDDGPPSDAPGWGVVVIPQVGGGWWGHDLAGLLDCLALPGPNVVVHGRSAAKRRFSELMQRADRDPDFPPSDDRTLMHGWDHYCFHGSY